MLMITTPVYLTNFRGFIIQFILDKIIVFLFYNWRIKAEEVTSLGSYIRSQYGKESKSVLMLRPLKSIGNIHAL